MKKIASRVLALVVALSMLLTATAFAAERNAATFTIGNFEIALGEQTISLPVYLSLGGGVDIEGARGYLTANLSTDTAAAVSALGAFENGEIKAYLNGMDYGFTIPLEQVIALLEQEMGMTVEEMITQAMSSIDEESMAAITGMMESAAALENIEVTEEEIMAALGLTLTEQGEATVTLFDVEAAANATAIEMKQQTCKEMFDALASLDPALAEYMANYFATMNESLAASGEEMTIEEALAMITMGFSGTIYDAGETGALADLSMSMTVEEETLEIPFTVVALNDEAGTYIQFSMLMDVDGESVYMEVYCDDYTEETVDNANLLISMTVGDTGSEENEAEVVLSFTSTDSAESSTVGARVYALSYGETVDFGFWYTGNPVVSTEAADSYDGYFIVYGEAEGMSFEASANTNLTLTSVPEGELLTFTKSINPLEADEETLSKIVTDAQNALIQGAGVLMQDPTIASMLGGLMG